MHLSVCLFVSAIFRLAAGNAPDINIYYGMFVPLEIILGVERGTSRSVSRTGPECVVSDKHARVEFYGSSIHTSVTSAETEIQSYARCENSIKSISRVLNKNMQNKNKYNRS